VATLAGGIVSAQFRSRPFDRPLLVFDVETTGANPRTHQIVEFGGILLDGATLEETRSMRTLVQVTQSAFEQADPRALAIHGLKFDQLVSAPPPVDVVTKFLGTFGTDFYFCGWNICFDTQFLAALFQEAGRYRDFESFRYHKLDLWSLLEFAWVLRLIPNPPESLSAACDLFGIKRAAIHDAMEDARISAEVLRKILRLLEGAAK
jgi:DNA polymerase III epsilon subunit-like protein